MLRTSVLRRTMRFEILRTIFVRRDLRLFSWFILWAGVALITSTAFPLYVLAIGPVIYGIPHLFSSMRYLQRSVSETPDKEKSQKSLRFFSTVFGIIATYRILTDIVFQRSIYPLGIEVFPETVSVIVTCSGLAFIYGSNWRRFLQMSLVVGPFLYFAWNMPSWTAGALILLHNFIAFFYWVLASKKKSELLTSGLATGIFVGLNAGIFLGYFDFTIDLFGPTGQLHWAELDYISLGQLIAPWSGDEMFLYHCVLAYAFGQSMHYFVWLKAIPEQHHVSDLPTSFGQSVSLMKKDLGHLLGRAAILLTLGFVVVFAVVNFYEARLLYFAVAAYHGYMELAGLGLARLQLSPQSMTSA